MKAVTVCFRHTAQVVTSNKYGKIPKFTVVSIMLMLLASCQPTVATDSARKTTSYESSSEDFPNPERGFFVPFNPLGKYENAPLQLADVDRVRSDRMSLVRRIYTIEEFRNKPIAESFLQKISNDCEIARKSGLKIIIRFSYNWLGGGPDASRERILSHIEQLKPILTANYDVIAYMEAGFIGYWGEWNKSSNGLDNNNEDRKAILFKLLSVFPKERMVAIRYSRHKIDIFNNINNIESREAFNGSYRSRTGFHNDCFLASIDDKGTYKSTIPLIVEAQKTFLNQENRYVVQGGETCQPSEYDDCPNTLNELSRMRWSALNIDNPDAREIVKKWETQGCLPEIKRNLGYRFRLTKTLIPYNVKVGNSLAIELEIINDGWASPYNHRGLEVILRNRGNRKEYYLPVKEDPRRWMPGTTKIVKIEGGIPKTMSPGVYEVLLNLPDPAPRLYNRPEYSIRFANKDVWETATGYNYLLQTVIIDPSAERSNYAGEEFFRVR
ncbi:DUF4832 domain-containing protein [Argonema galeatum]|uniref:DUF4832 domain-containing protein n=1 Tax=Argonema galeatum TaxID=2942762 RepID=UPI002012619A|nr:DUF4832 domain-containing protein [Argonema galeatum]MCL1467419.1 DUF4832 domain-containing protein [Argonema galeatum A003/A1]